jgi:hypothetical protein
MRRRPSCPQIGSAALDFLDNGKLTLDIGADGFRREETPATPGAVRKLGKLFLGMVGKSDGDGAAVGHENPTRTCVHYNTLADFRKKRLGSRRPHPISANLEYLR